MTNMPHIPNNTSLKVDSYIASPKNERAAHENITKWVHPGCLVYLSPLCDLNVKYLLIFMCLNMWCPDSGGVLEGYGIFRRKSLTRGNG